MYPPFSNGVNTSTPIPPVIAVKLVETAEQAGTAQKVDGTKISKTRDVKKGKVELSDSLIRKRTVLSKQQYRQGNRWKGCAAQKYFCVEQPEKVVPACEESALLAHCWCIVRSNF